jgi:succinate-semialdehyde dehydrogenase/glutarate-semialdehyde dehydrogenase
MKKHISMYRSQNPATEEVMQEYPQLSSEEAWGKLAVAEQAFALWKKTSLKERLSKIEKLAEGIQKHLTEYAWLMTREMGKPIAQSEVELDKCMRGCRYYIEHAPEMLKPRSFPTEAQASYVRYDPLGVILGIMPWNFPFWQVLRFSLPALAAGNVVLLKHAPNVPGCAEAIESLYREAGFPEGVFQNLFLSHEDAANLIASGRVQGVSLTGSDRAGSAVGEVAGRSLVKMVLELGGSDPFIVLDDADLEVTMPWAMKSRMLNTGQSCIAAKRFLVTAGIYDKFLKKMSQAVAALKAGDPTLRSNDLGPLAREDLLKNLAHQVDQGIAQGARAIVGGRKLPQKGYFFEPSLLEVSSEENVLMNQEIFGPVAVIMKVSSENEAIRIANKTSYGLGASLWTRDLKNAERLATQIEAGNVFINMMVKSDPRLPFGGIKRSGYGRELSEVGIHEFVNIKTVWVN